MGAKKTAEELRDNGPLYDAFCKHHIHHAQAYGEAVATSVFVHMLNPKYRGPKFRWDLLEDMVVGQAKATVFMGFSDRVWKRYGPLIKEAAVSFARFRVRELLKESGVETWLPLEPSSNA